MRRKSWNLRRANNVRSHRKPELCRFYVVRCGNFFFIQFINDSGTAIVDNLP